MSGLGENFPRVDGPAKLRGWAQFTADVEMPGMVTPRYCAAAIPMRGLRAWMGARRRSCPA
jgi:CO/xanthine dehydrogenase Mo-binding subunit